MEQTRAAVLWAWEVYSTLLLCEIKILAGCQQEEIPLNQQALQFSLNLTFKLYEREILTKQKFKVQIDYLRHNLLYLPWHAVDSQYQSVQLCPTLCDLMDCSTPGFPVQHQPPEPSQTHVHQVSDAIQPSHPVVPFSSHLQSFPASGCFPVSQFFASGGQSIGVSASASVLPINIQNLFPLKLTCLISLQNKGVSRVFSNTTVQKHQFFGAQLSL